MDSKIPFSIREESEVKLHIQTPSKGTNIQNPGRNLDPNCVVVMLLSLLVALAIPLAITAISVAKTRLAGLTLHALPPCDVM